MYFRFRHHGWNCTVIWWYKALVSSTCRYAMLDSETRIFRITASRWLSPMFPDYKAYFPFTRKETLHFRKVARGLPWWLSGKERICLPMQETGVPFLIQEDPTCWGATKPVCHNYWAQALEPVLCNKGSHWNEKPMHCKEEWPLLSATKEKPRAAIKTQCSQLIN